MEYYKLESGFEIDQSIFTLEEERIYFKLLDIARRRFYHALFMNPKVILRFFELHENFLHNEHSHNNDKRHSYVRMLVKSKNGRKVHSPSARNNSYYQHAVITAAGLLNSGKKNRFHKISRIIADLPWSYMAADWFYKIYINDPYATHISAIKSRHATYHNYRSLCISKNMRLAVRIAQDMRDHLYVRLPLIELVSYGIQGLIFAVDQYNCDLGHKFSTICTYWIKQSIVRESWYNRHVRIPIHIAKAVKYLERRKEERIKSDADIANKLKSKVSEIKYARDCVESGVSRNFKSLDCEIVGRGTGEVTLNAYVASSEQSIDDTRQQLDKALRFLLSPFQYNIISLRFFHQLTLETVADITGVTRERVRQIQKNSLQKLQLYKDSLFSGFREDGLPWNGFIMSRKHGKITRDTVFNDSKIVGGLGCGATDRPSGSLSFPEQAVLTTGNAVAGE